MSEAHVNLHLRNDVIGDVLRQKQTLDRVAEVLCDGLGDQPAELWRMYALDVDARLLPLLAARLNAIADLIESESL